MKLLRYGEFGSERPGILDSQGTLRDLSQVIPDLGPQQLSPTSLAQLRRIDLETLPVVTGHPRIGCPVHSISKLIAIGLNYSDHAAEAGAPIPEEPIIFCKAVSCIQGPDDDVMLPQGSTQTDWEVELGIVINQKTAYVSQAQAFEHIAGYLLANDISERDFQLNRGGTWDKGKGCDTFGPLGPWLVTQDEIQDPNNLSMWLNVNGQRRQTGHTQKMIFNVSQIVSYTSRFMTLLPGDVILTGTPPGVGLGMKPPQYLKAGDVMELGIEGLGSQKQRVVAFKR